jgi:putative hydrolase of the HAD superfamily
MRLNHAVLDVLADARRRGIRVSLLSNAPHALADAVSAHNAFTDFNHLVFSARIGLAKPDPAVFRATLDRLGVAPADVLFVDDRAENVAAAAAVGLQTCRFTDAGQLGRRLSP